MSAQRSSDKHSPQVDDMMKKEIESQLRAGRPTHVEPWHDPEPIEDENTPDEEDLIRERRAEEAGRRRGDRLPD